MPASVASKTNVLVSLLVVSALAQTNVTFSVDFTRDLHPISPYIYGINGGSITATDGATFSRSGGNRLTGYNWENNASNAGTDWGPNSSDALMGNTTIPGKAFTDFQDQNQAAGMKSLITLQAAGYVSRDKNGNVSAAEVAPSSRWRSVVFEKGRAFSASPDTTDSAVYMDELVNFLTQKYGPSSGSTGVLAYDMDNEPALWPSTHPRIHPVKTGAAELAGKNAALAKAVKQVDPTALIFGGVFYGYAEYANMQDAADWASLNTGNKYGWYIDYFLETLQKASATAGRRLLDVLDIHWYPEATGDHRIITDDVTLNDVKARMQAPRSLWDSNYVETSWISQWMTQKPNGTPGPIKLLPHIMASINKYYPGTRVSISEFNYGAPRHVSGGIATADFFGVLGNAQVFAANLWPLSSGPYFPAAYRLFRNYDGNKSAFGNLSVRAGSSNQDSASVYASFDANANAVHIIALNKSFRTPVHATFAMTSPVALTQARVFGFDSTSSTLTEKTAVTAITGNQFTYDLPALSAYHFVVQASAPMGVDFRAGKKGFRKASPKTGLGLLVVPGWEEKAARADGRILTLTP